MTGALLVDAGARLDHEIVGPANAPVLLALGGISATRHVVRHTGDQSPGWWEGVAGPGRALDTTSHRLLSVDFADGGRGPDGRPERVITTHDQAARIVELLDELGIEKLAAVVGASYGGMVALALAERWPERVAQLVVICAAHEPHPMAVGLRALQRRIVELGLDTGRTAEGMTLGRAVAMTTYRTAGEFADRFDIVPTWNDGVPEFDVERYLVSAGEKFAARVAPERYLALSLSTDLHRVTPEQIAVPTTLVPAQGDTLVPPAQVRAMAKRLPNLRGVHLLRSRVGHDSFLTEPRRLGAILSATLAD